MKDKSKIIGDMKNASGLFDMSLISKNVMFGTQDMDLGASTNQFRVLPAHQRRMTGESYNQDNLNETSKMIRPFTAKSHYKVSYIDALFRYDDLVFRIVFQDRLVHVNLTQCSLV